MSIDIIHSRLSSYAIQSKAEELLAIKEICQEITLAGLARAQFFKIAAFQGGTCLRILFGLKRFSEDLDFILQENSSATFHWKNYLSAIQDEFRSFGLQLDVVDRTKSETAIKKAFLKENSFGKILKLEYPKLISDKQFITIKLEIDTHPPSGSIFTSHYLEYPYPFSITCQDLPSLFASKCHALLCRPYVKGRDWFDFLFYISKKTSINFSHLSAALQQTGPFQGKNILINRLWLIKTLSEKIQSIDWKMAKKDVEIFLRKEEKKFVEAWDIALFESMLKKLADYLSAAEE